ncbi:MAG TPA: CRISPR-associated protein Cas4 [Chloroflexota bacterium]|nr:CRISPR-associated protein Cas4 [Chloroflexota bacterium]HZU07209.1 CRISPR-associated protein Cas4 [Chloroflexota bacterium]
MAAEPLPADSDLLPLAVSDVRQHVYCPRIPYFRLGLRLPHRPVTFKMAEGIRAHERTEALEARRSLHAYGLASGERHFAVALHSPRLGLSGRLDMAIVLPAEAIPVEWKNSAGPLGLNHKYQLAAYALLAEDCFGRPVRRAFVYWIPARRAEPVTITPAMRRYAKRVLADIRRAVAREQLPGGTRVLGRCRECEFLGYCNDRW